ncbi:MAG TPA: hypothetical protein DEF51_23560 [Myxococcales bacterium]|nr:hypothetical protein [Myxococcales bacterium]
MPHVVEVGHAAAGPAGPGGDLALRVDPGDVGRGVAVAATERVRRREVQRSHHVVLRARAHQRVGDEERRPDDERGDDEHRAEQSSAQAAGHEASAGEYPRSRRRHSSRMRYPTPRTVSM